MDPQIDRRQARSENTQLALTRFLEAARLASAAEALVLGDELGLLVAGAGAAELCDELAAVAPLGRTGSTLAGMARETPELDPFRSETEVRRLAIDGYEMFISGRGGDIGTALEPVLAGCARILVEKKSNLAH